MERTGERGGLGIATYAPIYPFFDFFSELSFLVLLTGANIMHEA